jgi:orotate phosphoribosyltransferase
LHDTGAVQRGHFRLSSGRHSDVFVQKFRLFERPRLTRALGAALAAAQHSDFDVVASPAVGAIPLGFAVALAADARFVFAERSAEVGLSFRRGFTLAAGERVLVIEDVVTTGGSAREVCDLVGGHGAEITGVGALIDRSDGRTLELPAPFVALLHIDAPAWDAATCPLCARGEAFDDPGSRRL